MTKTLYKNANLFDGINNNIKPDSWILVNNETGKIEAVDNNNDYPRADETIDLNGEYLIPGLINAHTHIVMNPDSGSGDTDIDDVQSTIRAIDHLHQLLKSGVTYIRELGTSYNIDIKLAKLYQQGKLKNIPGIVPSGHPYSMTGGHGDIPNLGTLADSPDEMRKEVRKGIKDGAKNIKVMATGGIMTPKDFMDDPQLSIDEMKTAADEAHHKGLTIAAHAEGNPGIYNAIKAGVDSVEHGFYVNDDEIDLILKQGTFITPTLVTTWAIQNFGRGKLPEWELQKVNNAFDDLLHNIKHAWQRGVKIALGTDAGCPFNYFDMTPKEFEIMVNKEEVSNFDALKTSYHSAQLLKIDDEYGSIEPDKYADFLILKDNPLKDIKSVQQEDKSVYQHGIKVY